MNLFFLWENLDSCNLFLFFFNHCIENELDVADELGSDMLVGFRIVGSSGDSIVVVEGEISQIELSILGHCWNINIVFEIWKSFIKISW